MTHMFGWARGLVCLLLVVSAACSPKSKRVMGEGGDGDGDGDGDVELPGGYGPRIGCGALGRSCDEDKDCGEDVACVGGTCLPSKESTGSCTDGCPKTAPLCVSNACMTADQLGCVCLDAHGAAVTSECDWLGELPEGQCLPDNALCDTHPSSCCRGTLCLQGKDDSGTQLLGVCKRRCATNADCETGCCIESESVGDKFCTDTKVCIERCRNKNEECDGLTRPCCDGMLCVASDSDPALNGCQPVCTKNSDCDTSCCVLFTDEHGLPEDNGVCGPADRCEGQ
jgi:hypothetical protein